LDPRVEKFTKAGPGPGGAHLPVKACVYREALARDLHMSRQYTQMKEAQELENKDGIPL
jgi:hypothetical protein